VSDLAVVSKRQVCLTSTRSRHRSVDGDCVLRPKHTGGFDTMMDSKHNIGLHGQSPLPRLVAPPVMLTRMGSGGTPHYASHKIKGRKRAFNSTPDDFARELIKLFDEFALYRRTWPSAYDDVELTP
jgi:hypothetical protein